MLILSRRANEQILLKHGETEIVITLVSIRRDKVKLGIDAPQSVVAVRRELLPANDGSTRVGQELGGSDAASRQEP